MKSGLCDADPNPRGGAAPCVARPYRSPCRGLARLLEVEPRGQVPPLPCSSPYPNDTSLAAGNSDTIQAPSPRDSRLARFSRGQKCTSLFAVEETTFDLWRYASKV